MSPEDKIWGKDYGGLTLLLQWARDNDIFIILERGISTMDEYEKEILQLRALLG